MPTIIKAAEQREPLGAPYPFADLAAPAETGPSQARVRAAAILSAAEAEAAAIRARAEPPGRAAALSGAASVLDERVAAQLQNVLPALQKMVNDLEDAQAQWRSHWEKQAIHLAAAMARRIVRKELRHQPDIPLGLVAEALELCAGKPEVRILLNPEDYEVLHLQVQRIAVEMAKACRTEIVAAETVSRGGCRVESRHGVIDQTFEAQLDRIERELS